MKKLLMFVITLYLSVCSTACGKTNKDLTNAPTEEYVVSCLREVPGIIGIEAVTEDNDPNELLNKDGGYISKIYFSYSLVNQNDLYGNTIIEKGTNAGGSIEVYKNMNDATKRNEYLSSFDGTFLASGSHCIVGTIVVRTSNELTASQQKLLENNIVFALKGSYNSIDHNIGTANFNKYQQTSKEQVQSSSLSKVTSSTQNSSLSEVTSSESSKVADSSSSYPADSPINYGTYFMEKYANSYINIIDEQTVFFYDFFDDFNLQGYNEFTYTYIPANSADYENTYAMLEIDMSVLYPNTLSCYKYIHILDEYTIIFDGERFSN